MLWYTSYHQARTARRSLYGAHHEALAVRRANHLARTARHHQMYHQEEVAKKILLYSLYCGFLHTHSYESLQNKRRSQEEFYKFFVPFSWQKNDTRGEYEILFWGRTNTVMLHNTARVLACYLNASAETTHHHKNEVGVNKKNSIFEFNQALCSCQNRVCKFVMTRVK